MSDELQREMLKQLRDLNHRVSHLETLEYLQRHRSEVGCEELEFPAEPHGVCNGSFELGPTPNFSTAEGWSIGLFEAVSIAERSLDAYDGKYAARGGQPGTGGGSNWTTSHYYPVHEDIDYEVSAMVKSVNNGWVTVHVVNYDADKVLIGSRSAYSGNPGAAWTRITHRVGPNGDAAWTAGTKFTRIGLGLQTNPALTNAWGYADMVRFRPMAMADSRFIHLLDDHVQDPAARGFDKQAYTAHAGSVMNLTLEEESYIWYFYQMTAINATRAVAQSFYTKVYIDGVGQPGNNVWCSPGINYYVTDSFSQRSQAPYAMGPHTIDYRLWVANAGDVVWVGDLTGSCFAVRQY